jgi:hypothetical protein
MLDEQDTQKVNSSNESVRLVISGGGTNSCQLNSFYTPQEDLWFATRKCLRSYRTRSPALLQEQ